MAWSKHSWMGLQAIHINVTIRHKESTRIHIWWKHSKVISFIKSSYFPVAIKTWLKFVNEGLKCHVFVIRYKQWPRKCRKLQGGWFLCSWIRNCMMQRGVAGGMCYWECHRNDTWHNLDGLFCVWKHSGPLIQLSSCPYIILSYSYSPKVNSLPVVKRLNWGAKGCTRPKSERNNWANLAMKVCKGSCTTFGCSLFTSCSHHWMPALQALTQETLKPSLVTLDAITCALGDLSQTWNWGQTTMFDGDSPWAVFISPWLLVLYSGLYHLFIWGF